MRRGRIGSWVLLQPERINAYAQAVIQTLQAYEYQRGCLMEAQAGLQPIPFVSIRVHSWFLFEKSC